MRTKPSLRLLGAALIVALAFALPTTAASAKVKKKTFQTGGALAIPDATAAGNGVALQTLKIKKHGTIKDINIGVQITHTFDSELILELSKGGTHVRLASGNGGTGDNFGGGTGCGGPITVFDDSALTPINAAFAPFAGSFRPAVADLSLSQLKGEKLSGTWSLAVIDFLGTDTGTLNCFQVQAKYETP